MMAPHSQYMYDPVGSQASQPQGYTYQSVSASQAPYPQPTASSYQTPTYHAYGGAYNEQQYNPGAPNSSSMNNASHAAAAALSTLGAHGYAQSTQVSQPGSFSSEYNTSDGLVRPGHPQTSHAQLPGRSQSNRSPFYVANVAAPSSGRFIPHEHSQGEANSNNNPHAQYQKAISSASGQSSGHAYSPSSTSIHNNQTSHHIRSNQPPPPRYNSPLLAIQSQQNSSHRHVPSPADSTHQISPQMTSQDLRSTDVHQRQQSMSAEPSLATVNPSQVYDFRAEQQRKAEIEVQRRKKLESEESARQAEQARVEQERIRRKKEAQEAQERERAQREEEGRAHMLAEEAAKKRAALEQKKQNRRKAREDKRQSASAASALQQIASHSVAGDMGLIDADLDPAIGGDESEMRAMFKRMREFNQRNPAMLARLWEEERQAHAVVPSAPSSEAAKSAPKQTQARQTKRPSANASNKTPAPQVQETSFSSQGARRPHVDHANVGPSNGAAATNTVDPPAEQSTDIRQQTATTSLWPAQKKGLLADTAAKWLNSLSTNRASGRTISKEAILRALDSNPSYEQLCEAIEKFGTVFQRSALARELLKVVPDGLRSQPALKSNSPPVPLVVNASHLSALAEPRPSSHTPQSEQRVGSATVSYRTPSFTPIADVARAVGETGIEVSTSLHPVAEPTHNHSYQGHQSTNSAHDSDTKTAMPSTPEATFPPPAAARPPADKEEAARKRTFSDLVDLSQGDSDDEAPPRKIPALTPNTSVPPSKAPYEGTFRDPITFQQFRQAQYQPRPAATFLYNQPQVYQPTPPKSSTPVSTTNAQPIPPPKPKGPTAEQEQIERIRGKMLVEPLMRDRVARKSKYDSRTIARDVLLATGRHPDMRPLNAHFNTMDKLLSTHGGATDGIGNKSDLSTIRWDVIDPGAPVKTEHDTKNMAAEDDAIEDADDEDDEPMLRRVSDSSVTRPESAQPPGGRFAERGKVRRGRPPSKSLHTSANVPDSSRDNTPKSQGTMSSSVLPSNSGPSGYAAFRQVDEHGNVIKKKGRPVGWRKNIHSREAHGLTPAKTPKPRSVAQTKNQLDFVQPQYQIYRCRWRDCPSELHNLDVLKKHIVKVHGQANVDGMYACNWRGCTASRKHVDHQGIDRIDPALFRDIESWMDHVDSQHLQNIAWRLGDGPRGGGLSEQVALSHDSETSYLSDSQGRSVTPIVLPERTGAPRQPPSNWTLGRQLKGNLSKEERDAVTELTKLEEIKRAEGPYMGTEGTRLANAKRRLGFLDDEDFADEVESSELGED